jgi:prophage tail gpP-like protein
MADPYEIYIGGSKLEGWTESTLTRKKKDMTGELSVSIFFSYVPKAPVMVGANRGKEITVYVGGQLAFTGKVDSRTGTGAKHGKSGTDDNPEQSTDAGGGGRSVSIGPNEYTVKLTARGKTKYLIDSSHQHKTTNMMQPTNKEVVEKLVSDFQIDLDWKSKVIKLDKVRFRDGAKVADEIFRVGSENGHFIYETREGKLRVTDGTGDGSGEALILGQNILTFSAEQSEEDARSEVKVKGQRTKKELWGEAALLKTEKTVKDAWVQSNAPYIIQHYGDATDEALERRAKFETDKRSSESKTVTIEVFHVQTTTGDPWDIGNVHYVEVPPEGIFDEMECTELTYTVQNDKTLKTTLTLSPPPSGGVGGGIAGEDGGGLLSALGSAVSSLSSLGASRRAAAGVTFTPGQYPSPWSGPVLTLVADVLPVEAPAPFLQTLVNASQPTPPLKIS